MNKITAERLRELVNYDPETGVFTSKPALGTPDRDGYLLIQLDGKQYKAHRLAWLFTHSEWPAGVVDHRNGLKSDNRIENLRDITNQHNLQAVQKPTSANTSGYRGVNFHKAAKRWRAQISINGKSRFLGYADTAKDAYALYQAAKAEHHLE